MRERFEQIGNVLFVVVVSAVLLCVIATKALGFIGVLELKDRSELEGRVYQATPAVTAESLMSGDFQSDFEQSVADAMPKRDGVLLANASVQRALISTANMPFGFAVCPTYYGSDYVYSPSMGIVGERPAVVSESAEKKYVESARTMAKAMREHQNLRWKFCLVDRPSTCRALPVHDLVSNAEDYQYLTRLYAGQLPDMCTIVDLSYENLEEYLEDYYRTDHHWRAVGGYKAWKKIVGNQQADAPDASKLNTLYGGPYWGACARNGACLQGEGDTIEDFAYPLDDATVHIDGKKKKASSLSLSYANSSKGYKKETRFSNAYADVFHTDYGLIDLKRNGASDSGDTLLLVGDSFSNCMERYFLQTYDHVIVVDPRHYDGTLDGILRTEKVDDVVLMLSRNNVAGQGVAEFLG